MKWKLACLLLLTICLARSESAEDAAHQQTSKASADPVARQASGFVAYNQYDPYSFYDPYAITGFYPQPQPNRSTSRLGLYLLLLNLIRGLSLNLASTVSDAPSTAATSTMSTSTNVFQRDGWLQAGNQCYYKYFLSGLDWVLSRDDCLARGATLAYKGFKGTDAIAKERHVEILQLLGIHTASTDTNVWIGIENTDGDANYNFIDGSSATTQANWEATPTANAARCGVVKPGQGGFGHISCIGVAGRLCEFCPFS